MPQRPPLVTRFPEATFVDLSQVADEEVQIVAPAPSVQARTHLIKVGESEGKSLRFLSLYRLPDRLLERTLAPNHEKANKLLIDGLTCRAVRWTAKDGDIFNGRTGIGQSLEVAEADQLQLPDFQQLDDSRSNIDVADDVPTKTWEHVGKAPELSKWLQGTGQTRCIDPAEKPDIPKDARRYIASGPTNPTGRLRVPKGYDLLPDTADEDAQSSADENDGQRTAAAFNALLAGTAVGDGTDDYSESVTSDDSDDDRKPMIFSELFKSGTNVQANGQANGKPPKRTSGQAQSARPLPEPHFQMPPSRKPTPTTQVFEERTNMPPCNSPPSRTISTKVQARSVHGGLADYGGRFAKVDDIGLTASAANTAQWEIDNYVRRSPKKKSRPVVARSTAASTTGETANGNTERSMSGERSSSTFRPPSTVPVRSFTPMRPDPREADWVNKPAVGNPQRGPKLVDDTATTTSGTVPVPPGFTFSQNPPTRQAQHQQLNVESNDLDEEIIEQVKPLPPNYAVKRNTMRQQAGKKGKGKKAAAKASAPKVHLPLPDPVPPPKRKEKETHEPPAPPPPASFVDDEESSDDDTPPRRTTTVSTSIDSGTHAFGQFLVSLQRGKNEEEEEDGMSSDSGRQVKLVSSIGILLTRPGKDFYKGTITPVASQKQLNASNGTLRTNLLQRLTTSTDDATCLLSIGGAGMGPVSVETVYEIGIHDASGTPLAVRVPTKHKVDYTVKTGDRVSAKAYAHYPTHVWDAMFTLVKPGTDNTSPSDEAIREFVESMQTLQDQAPSFKAMERVGLITVQAVQAKRIFTREGKGGTLKITQVQQMATEAMNDGRHNFKAVAEPHLQMVNNHRLWWEARWETEDLEKAGLLEEKVDETVRAMDAVGLGNKGPYEYQEPELEDEQEAAQEVPFW